MARSCSLGQHNTLSCSYLAIAESCPHGNNAKKDLLLVTFLDLTTPPNLGSYLMSDT